MIDPAIYEWRRRTDPTIAKWIELTMNAERAEEAVEELVKIGEPVIEPIIEWEYVKPQPPEEIQWKSITWTSASGAVLHRLGPLVIPYLIRWYKREKSKYERYVPVAYISSIGANEEALEFLYNEWFSFPNFPPSMQRLLRAVLIEQGTRFVIVKVFTMSANLKYQDLLIDALDDIDCQDEAFRGLKAWGDRRAIPALKQVVKRYEHNKYQCIRATRAREVIEAIMARCP